MKAINTAVMLIVVVSLAACSSGGFSKGDNVVVIQPYSMDNGYCEGTVVSSKGGYTVVNVSDCRNGGLSSLQNTGMSRLKNSSIRMAQDGLAIVAARQQLQNSDAASVFRAQQWTDFATMRKKDIDQAIKLAKNTDDPLLVPYAKFIKTTLPVFNYLSNHTLQGKDLDSFVSLYSDTLSDTADAADTFLEKMKKTKHGGEYGPEGLTVTQMQDVANQLVELYSMVKMSSVKPRQTVKDKIAIETTAEKFRKKIVAAVQKYTFTPSPNLTQYVTTDTPKKNVKEEYRVFIDNQLQAIVQSESDMSDITNADIIAQLKKAAAPFGDDAKKDLAFDIGEVSGRIPMATIKKTLAATGNAKFWRMKVSGIGTVDLAFEMAFGKREIIADATSPGSNYPVYNWNTSVDKNGAITIYGRGGFSTTFTWTMADFKTKKFSGTAKNGDKFTVIAEHG